jgi:microcystin-dependent protein
VGLESATFVQGLDATNPLSTDKKTQGDDHLRLIKSVLKNTFQRATKAWAFPDAIFKSANYTVLATDMNLIIRCNMGGGPLTLTLPTLAVSDAGWYMIVVKEDGSANPVFIQPASGTINGFSKIRRSVASQASIVMWTGAFWFATRPNGAPIGSILDFVGFNAPPGFLLCTGAAFNVADYVELNLTTGLTATPDLRGRILAGADDLGGVAAGRLNGLTVAGVMGQETWPIAQGNLPNYTLPNTLAINDDRVWRARGGINAIAAGTAHAFHASVHDNNNIIVDVMSGGISLNGGVTLGGSGIPIQTVQPTMGFAKIIVAE